MTAVSLTDERSTSAAYKRGYRHQPREGISKLVLKNDSRIRSCLANSNGETERYRRQTRELRVPTHETHGLQRRAHLARQPSLNNLRSSTRHTRRDRCYVNGAQQARSRARDNA